MHTVNGSVVELDALSDPDGAGTYNDDRLLGTLLLRLELEVSLVLSAFTWKIICTVEIRRRRGKLSRARINHLIYRHELIGSYRAAGDLLHRAVREAELLAGNVILTGDDASLYLLLKVNKILYLVEEPHVYLGDLVDLLAGHAPVESFTDEEEPLICRL